ncbi:MAG TPA: RluA family pseudouridine synthase [Tepidisphaeraceae bacterium]|jgi:23S rRNA pseudouridine1911/1915/1917 synthase|nr:RluA family pseudouridine synthase [Tepidisphaeraceae bacterium]
MILLDRLREQFPTAKRQTLKRMVQSRRVLINNIPAAKLTHPIRPEDRIAIVPEKKGIEPSLPFPIIFEDRDILIINKPAGLLTSTVPRERRPTALAAVTRYLRATDPAAHVGLIHRLDRDAAGLLVFSKNPAAYASLKTQFFHHTVARIYHALVSPPPKADAGRIDSRLIERADGSVHSTHQPNKGQPAVTDFVVTSRHGNIAHLKVTLHTGRKHQIRVHLSESGFPILGDTQYAGKPDKSGLHLTAVHLAFDHPRTSKRLCFQIAD